MTVAIGCSGPTVPTVAVAGTTIGIPLSGDHTITNGTGLAYGVPGMPDPQRGALKIDLMSGSTFVANLPIRLVTRVMPDPSSPAALAGSINGPEGINVPWIQQVVAVV